MKVTFEERMQRPITTGMVNALNRYLKKRFNFPYRVNSHIAKYLRTCSTDRQLAGVLRYLKEAIGRSVKLDCRNTLQWQPGE